MAFGNKRGGQPKREQRRIQETIFKHIKRTEELVKEGYTKEEASKKAYKEIVNETL